MDEDSGSVAAALVAARQSRQLMPPIDARWLPDQAAAMIIQSRAATLLGEKRVGWKIGATGKEMQQRLGTDRPFTGPIFAPDVYESGARLEMIPGLRGVEVEIAFRLGADLPPREEPWTLDEVRAAIGSMHPAIEVVGLRQDLPALDLLRATADFGVNAAFVYGDAIPLWETLDLPAVTATCWIDGTARGTGPASAVLGNPLEALRWLANEGIGLEAGDWVSTGTLTGLLPIGPGSEVTGDFGPLGRVSCSFTAG